MVDFLAHGLVLQPAAPSPSPAVIDQARRAVARALAAWKAENGYVRPLPLTYRLRPDGEPETGATLEADGLAATLRPGVNCLMTGAPGAGKTFSIITLAEHLLGNAGGPLPVLCGAPAWARSQRGLTEFVAALLGSPNRARQYRCVRRGPAMRKTVPWAGPERLTRHPARLTGWPAPLVR